MSFNPTNEQLTAVEIARTGKSFCMEALAGAGKTSTLRLIAEALPDAKIQYVAFNKKIVEDAEGSFPENVACNTAHSLAYRAVGWRYRGEPRKRITSGQAAAMLGIDIGIVFDVGEASVEVHPSTMAALASQAVDRFCQTDDRKVSAFHVPHLPTIDAPGEYTNNRILARKVAPYAAQIWSEMQRGGRWPMGFRYLKQWHLEGAKIDADVILFDEAQDANPLMMAIVEAQPAQKVWVGDTFQSIYEWNGAVNALARVKVDDRCHLTESFRFGPEIAEAANVVLARLGAEVRVKGSGRVGSVGPVEEPDVYLGRTNAAVISQALVEMAAGRRVCVQGGTKELEWFAREAAKLMDGVPSDHPDLTGFRTWGEVQNYVEADKLGQDLKLMVNLVDEFGVNTIMDRLAQAVSPKQADVTVSTAHKAKGAEWRSVRLLPGFPPDPPEEDLRLLYVAVTRARVELDVDSVDLAGEAGVESLVSAPSAG